MNPIDQYPDVCLTAKIKEGIKAIKEALKEVEKSIKDIGGNFYITEEAHVIR
jgi:hypothetical protein